MNFTDPEQVLEAYRAAVFAKDVEALLALYDEDAFIFDMWSRWSYRGAAAWRAMAEQWFGSLGSDRVEVEFAEVGKMLSGDLAVLHASVTYRGVSATGETLRAMQNRLTCALKRSESGWKIVHEHSSAPADPETGRVILQR